LFTNNIRADQGILNTCAISLMDKCKGYLPQNNADRVMLPCPTPQGNPQPHKETRSVSKAKMHLRFKHRVDWFSAISNLQVKAITAPP
jgi:hypothetical protein